jgi:hypothetical protein
LIKCAEWKRETSFAEENQNPDLKLHPRAEPSLGQYFSKISELLGARPGTGNAPAGLQNQPDS